MTRSVDDVKQSLPSGLPAIFRPRDLAMQGVAPDYVRTLVRRGEVERLGRGLYRRLDTVIEANETVAAVCARVPDAIVCLLSALRFYEIGTQDPRRVWIAIPNKAWEPRITDLPVMIVRFSGQMLTYGVVTREIGGVPVRITSPSRTVVDCFRYRNKVGVDVALEALKDALSLRLATVDEIVRAADVCRIRNVIQPYLEAVVA